MEAVLCQHIGVAVAVVVGIPDTRLTEKLIACVLIEEDWIWVDEKTNNSLETNQLSSEMMQNYCRQRKLTRYSSSFSVISMIVLLQVSSMFSSESKALILMVA